jgi:transposase-like protein
MSSWRDVLRNPPSRGLKTPKLVVGDGALGLWAALLQLWPEAKEQRCWNHKLVNVLDKQPKKVQPEAKQMLTPIPYAPTRAEAAALAAAFRTRYGEDHPKAVACLLDDWDRMVTFYEFRAEHWKHLRTTNIIESPLTPARRRTDASKRFKRVQNATAMIWKVLCVAQKRFRRLDAAELARDVHAGRQFVDGKPVVPSSTAEVAA